MKEFNRKLKLFVAFSLGRRKSAWIGFKRNCSGKIIFGLFNTFHRKNIHFYTEWSEKTTKSRITIFAFRDRANLEKFLRAEKLNWQDNFEEKTQLLGEALGYPSFAIEDFITLSKARDADNDSEVKFGDRIGFDNYNYGYDGFVFKPENLPKIEKWCAKNKIPPAKSRFKIYETELRKWRNLSQEELAEIRKTGKVNFAARKAAE